MGDTISANAARRITGENHYTLMRLALMGKLRYTVELGEPIRYVREDVNRLATERRAIRQTTMA